VLLEPLRRALERQGFRAVNWRYGNLRGSIEAHAARLAAKAKEFDEDAAVERLHFVGHSMGAIVVRSALTMTRPRKLGRVVLLRPGSDCGNGASLASRQLRESARASGGSDCGIIAASWDHVVSLGSTYLLGQRDHLVLRSLHTLPLHRHTSAQVALPSRRSFHARD
jgi:pimeloyl-ACP methyl ester carboxylesterase